MAYDLTSYEGRQAARDAGNWVGADSSGKIVMEPSSGGGSSSSVGSGSVAGTAPSSAPVASSGGGGALIYNTVNGPRTPEQMMRELESAGWDHRGEIKDVYARTTGGAVTATGQTAPAPGGPGVAPQPLPYQGFNQQAADLAMQLADRAAQQAYLRGRLNLDTDIEAHRQAEAVWRQTFDKAQADRGWAVSEAELTGLYNGAPTLAAQTEQNRTALGFLDLLSKQRGPANAFQYARTLQGTPEGMKSIVDAAAGRYMLGGAPSGEIAQGASLGTLIADATGASGAAGIPQTGQLPYAGQINPQAYNAMNPTQRALLWGGYEYGLGPTGAMTPEDAQAAYLKSLPKYTFSTPTTGKVTLPKTTTTTAKT